MHASSDSISNGTKENRFPLHAASKMNTRVKTNLRPMKTPSKDPKGCCGFTLPFYAEGSFGISSRGRFFVVPGGGVKGCFGLFSSYGISNSDTVEAACSGCKKSDTNIDIETLVINYRIGDT
ncbi:hypothetical protein LXL04_023436 [Taraxacum kok-saghyz]